MKKILFTIVAALAFIGLFAEKADGSMPVFWTLLCLAALYLAARGLQKIFDRKTPSTSATRTRWTPSSGISTSKR